jgi:hypothetical protein
VNKVKETTLTPPGWAEDGLTKRLDDARHNIFSTFFHHKPFFLFLSRIYDLFLELAEIMARLSDESTLESSPAAFLSRAFGSYFAAIRLSGSGQFAESFALFRVCLENTIYGYYIHRKPEMANIWLNRHKDNEATKKVKANFQIKNILELLDEENKQVSEEVRMAYDKTIDFGAHPNVYSIACNLKYIEDERRWVLDIFQGDDFFLKSCLLANARIGLLALSVFRQIYFEEFKETDIPKKIFELFSELNKLSGEIKNE